MAASGSNPHLLRLQVHNSSGRSSPHDSHPGTPWREEDEHAPLLRSGDIDRTAYNGSAMSQKFVCIAHLFTPFLGDRGNDLEADTIKFSATSTIWARAQYYVPSLHWIPNYTLSLYAILIVPSRVANCHRCGMPTGSVEI